MARLWQCGFELNTLTADVEIHSASTGLSIVTSPVNGGTYALKATGSNAFQAMAYTFGASATGPFYFRFYFQYSTLPDAADSIFTAGITNTIQFSTAGKLQLMNNSTQIGSDSPALTANTWYRVEVLYDHSEASGSQVLTAQLNGVQFATASNLTLTAGNLSSFQVGHHLGSTTPTVGTYFFDDIAINDSTTGNQNTYPGAGYIVHLQPSAAGDDNSFTVAVGGTAGSSNNFTRVREVTPDDATSYNGGVLNTDIDDFAMTATPSSIGSNDTINVVMVGVRFNAAVAASEASFKVRIKKVTGGTVTSSAAITPNSTTWKTNANASPWAYPLITYTNPDSAAWTKALLDTSQVGYNISTTNTNAADISTVWVSIDSTPAVITTNTGRFFSFFNP